jgi:hypothetical protein
LLAGDNDEGDGVMHVAPVPPLTPREQELGEAFAVGVAFGARHATGPLMPPRLMAEVTAVREQKEW